MPVLDLAQNRFNIIGHCGLAQADVNNRNHLGRDLVDKSARVLGGSEVCVGSRMNLII
jgi:hypothetical protein